MADIRGGSFTGRNMTLNFTALDKPPESRTVRNARAVPEMSGGGKMDNSRFVPLPLMRMLSRLKEPSGSSNIVENVSCSGGVSASQTVNGMPISGTSSSVTCAGMAEMIGGVFCCARTGAHAANKQHHRTNCVDT